MKKLTKAQIDANNAVEDSGVDESKRVPAAAFKIDGNAVRIAFADNTETVLDTAELDADLKHYAMMDRLVNKLRDAGALGVTKDANGRVHRPTDEEKKAAILAMRDQLLAGDWNAKREAGPSGSLWDAYAVVYPGKFADKAAFDAKLAEEAAKIGMDGKPRGEKVVRAAIANRTEIATEIARQRAARMKSDDTDAILASMDI